MSHAVRPPDALDGLASALFRFRSVTPLPVLVAAVVLSWRAHIFPGPGGALVDATLDVLGVCLSLGGLAVRIATAGFEPDARPQTRRLAPASLHTRGLYQLTRHPLYFGNALITLGLLLVVHRPEAYLLVIPAFALEYGLFLRAEERALHEAFGSEWERWADTVPMLLPRSRASGTFAGQRFDWRSAARREVNAVVAWGVTALTLLGWEWWARELLTERRAFLVRVGVGGLLGLLLANKVWKKVQPK